MSAAATASSSCWLSRSFWVELSSTAYRPLCRPPWRRWRPRGRRTRCGPAGGRATSWSIRWRGCVDIIMPVQGENRNNKLINKLDVFCFIHCIPLIWQAIGWAGASPGWSNKLTVNIFACPIQILLEIPLSPDFKWLMNEIVFYQITIFVKPREREGQRVDLGRSLKGLL